jgi:hypothetical protein
VRFEVLTAVKKTMLFWVVTPCGLVGRHIRFEEIYCHPEDGDSMFLRTHDVTTQKTNIDKYLIVFHMLYASMEVVK